MNALKKSQTITGTEYANRAAEGSIRVQREEATNLYAFAISELQNHSETPEDQLSNVIQVLIDADDFKAFRPHDWSNFFNICSKKF